jgi:hypothetical protein
MSGDQLNDFIAAQHQTNLHLTESMARVETLLAENSRRLFGGDGQLGALPLLYEKVNVVEKRTGALEGWKRSSVAWIAGAIAVLTLEASAFALYFQHLSGKIH